MKRCTNCNTDKPKSDFHKNSRRKDGLQSFCKACMIEIVHRRYQDKESKATILASQKKKLHEMQKIFDEVRGTNGCCLCGETCVACLDFHHIDPTEKDQGVSYWRSSKSKDKMIEEMQRCAVLCANCHRKLHAGLLHVDRKHCCLIPEAVAK